MVQIQVCMGSSCFARGNARVVDLIREFVRNHALESKVKISGSLCEDQCGNGPWLRIDDRVFQHVTPAVVGDILREALLGEAPATTPDGTDTNDSIGGGPSPADSDHSLPHPPTTTGNSNSDNNDNNDNSDSSGSNGNGHSDQSLPSNHPQGVTGR